MTNIQTLRESTFPLPSLLPLLSPQVALGPFGEAVGGTGLQGEGVVVSFCHSLFLTLFFCSSFLLTLFLCSGVGPPWATVCSGRTCSGMNPPGPAVSLGDCCGVVQSWLWLAQGSPWPSPMEVTPATLPPSPPCYQNLAKGIKYSLQPLFLAEQNTRDIGHFVVGISLHILFMHFVKSL